MKISVLTLVILLNGFWVSAQIDLSLNLQVGQRFSLTTFQSITIVETPFGVENKTSTTVSGAYHYTVLEKRDSGYLMEVKFTDFSQATTAAGSSSSFSSTATDTIQCMNKVLKRIINRPFQVVMNKEYQWRELIGFDDVFREAFATCATTEATRRIVDSVLMANKSSFIQNGSIIPLSLYSGGGKPIGKVWTEYAVSEHVVPTMDSCRYLVEIYGDNIVVKGSGTTSSLEKETVANGLQIRYSLMGPIDYQVVFQKGSHWMTNGTFKVSLSGNAVVRKEGSILTSTIPVSINTEGIITGASLD